MRTGRIGRLKIVDMGGAYSQRFAERQVKLRSIHRLSGVAVYAAVTLRCNRVRSLAGVNNMFELFRNLMRDTRGATAIEYAIIASVISVAALGAFLAVGEQSEENFETVASKYAGVQ